MSDLWSERAYLRDYRAVLDPSDTGGRKKEYIDLIHKQALTRNLKLSASARVLDFGCGIGRLTHWLAPQVGQVVGCDASLDMLDVAARRSDSRNVIWIGAVGQALPLMSASIDTIVSVFVLQHILDDVEWRMTLQEFARVLQVGGEIALIEQVHAQSVHTVSGYIKHRLASEYVAAFREAGLRPRLLFPIRVTSPLTQIAAKSWFPRRWFATAAQVDSKGARLLSKYSKYTDYFMVFSKCA